MVSLRLLDQVMRKLVVIVMSIMAMDVINKSKGNHSEHTMLQEPTTASEPPTVSTRIPFVTPSYEEINSQYIHGERMGRDSVRAGYLKPSEGVETPDGYHVLSTMKTEDSFQCPEILGMYKKQGTDSNNWPIYRMWSQDVTYAEKIIWKRKRSAWQNKYIWIDTEGFWRINEKNQDARAPRLNVHQRRFGVNRWEYWFTGVCRADNQSEFMGSPQPVRDIIHSTRPTYMPTYSTFPTDRVYQDQALAHGAMYQKAAKSGCGNEVVPSTMLSAFLKIYLSIYILYILINIFEVGVFI